MRNGGKTFLQSVRDSALYKNPVLFEAVGLAPVAAMAVSLKSAIMLACVSCAELILIELFACLALRKVKSYFRMPIYAILGVLINIPFFMFFEHFTPNEANAAGIFLPILAVNSLVALHCERFAVKNPFKSTFIDALSASAGYAFVTLTVGIVREILGSGTLYSEDLFLPVQLKGFLMPFGGFLLLGFLAAAVKGILQKKSPDAHPEQAFSMKEISQSHIGSLKSLIDTEFYPYGEDTDEAEKDAAPPRVKKEKKEKKAKRAKSEKGKKVRKAKSAKASDAVAAETVQPSEPVSSTAEEAAVPDRASRVQRENYLQDFDEMLTELDLYKQKQQDAPDESGAVQAENPSAEEQEAQTE